MANGCTRTRGHAYGLRHVLEGIDCHIGNDTVMCANTAAHLDAATNIVRRIELGKATELESPVDIVQAFEVIGITIVAAGDQFTGETSPENARIDEAEGGIVVERRKTN